VNAEGGRRDVLLDRWRINELPNQGKEGHEEGLAAIWDWD